MVREKHKRDNSATDPSSIAGGQESLSPAAKGSRKEFLAFLAMAAVWLLVIYTVSHVQSMEILHVGASMLLFSIPICVAGIFTSTLRQEFGLALFMSKGWVYALWSRRLLRNSWWVVFAFAMSFLLFLQFQVYTTVEWVVLASVIPVYPIILALYRRMLLKELRADVAVSEALILSRRTCPLVMVVLYVLASAYWGDLPQTESFKAIFDEYTIRASDWSGSSLVQVGLSWTAYFDALKAYALGHLGEVDALWALLAMGIGNFAVFYTACLVLSCFLIPRTGFVQARLLPRSGGAIFLVATVTTIVTGFIYFPSLARLDELVSGRGVPRAVVDTTCEFIDGECYRAGTCAQIATAHAAVAARVAVTAASYRREVDAAFEQLEDAAVEEYLDWYYSLSAEYVRIWMMLTGRLESHMEGKFKETIQKKQWYQGVDDAFNAMLTADAEARTEYEQTVGDVLDRNRVEPEPANIETTSRADIIEPSCNLDFMPPVPRWGASGASSVAAGGISYIIIQKVAAKALGKSVFKLGAKALTGKVAGAGGAVVGGAIGSIVPGPGTAIGAVVGGLVVGATIGVAVDGALLKLEEALSRDDFKRELVTAIREARREFEGFNIGQPSLPAPPDAGGAMAGDSWLTTP